MFALLLFVFFGDMVDITKGVHSMIFKTNPRDMLSFPSTQKTVNENTTIMLNVVNHTIIEPSEENNWCKIQQFQQSDFMEDPISIKIIGWDVQSDCCVREVYGYNCALYRNSTMDACFTANIGGVFKYVLVDNVRQNEYFYNQILQDYDKYGIPNKLCNASIYVRGG